MAVCLLLQFLDRVHAYDRAYSMIGRLVRQMMNKPTAVQYTEAPSSILA
jgi:hypothetical protein